MAARSPIHIASEAARREQRRTGYTTRCGLPLSGDASVAYYWDCPTNEDLLEETCPDCITTYRKEKTDGKKRPRSCGAHFGR